MKTAMFVVALMTILLMVLVCVTDANDASVMFMMAGAFNLTVLSIVNFFLS